MHLFNWKKIQHEIKNKIFYYFVSQLSISESLLFMSKEKRRSYSKIACLMGLTYITATFSNTAFSSINSCPEGFNESINNNALVCTTTQSLQFDINELGIADHDVVIIQAFGAKGAQGNDAAFNGDGGSGGNGGEARTYQLVSALPNPLTISIAGGSGQATIVSADDTYLLVAGGGGRGGNAKKYSGDWNSTDGGTGGKGGVAFGGSAAGLDGVQKKGETVGRGGNPNGLGQGGAGAPAGTNGYTGKGGDGSTDGGNGYGGGGGANNPSGGGGGGSYAIGYASTNTELMPASNPNASGSVIITAPLSCSGQPCQEVIIYGADQNACLQVNGPLEDGEEIHYVQHCSANANNVWIHDKSSGRMLNSARPDLCLASVFGNIILQNCQKSASNFFYSWQYMNNTGHLRFMHYDGYHRCLKRDSNNSGSRVSTSLCAVATELFEWDL
ncbi:ricin-type beta-trefoil lectin domain protein [uncultured Shewanella sp.]|uniref:ricin-type beta-trefoil lectin domain protein n=1 Tax=uncultured Shewanella sp. TaxID=173975 RepID=UPI0026016C76|nr:ricin-type beta-trefoil lectin domain protein [uncultured Shewanella sp.]